MHEHDLRRAQASTALGLSETRIEALRVVAGEPEPLTMGQLAARLHTDRPYASVVVEDLERHGLVERLRHPTDRRLRLASATAEGRRVAARAEAALGGGFRGRLQALSPAELAALDTVLEHLERPLAHATAPFGLTRAGPSPRADARRPSGSHRSDLGGTRHADRGARGTAGA